MALPRRRTLYSLLGFVLLLCTGLVAFLEVESPRKDTVVLPSQGGKHRSRVVARNARFYPERIADPANPGTLSGMIRSREGGSVSGATVTAWLSPETGGAYHNLAPRHITRTSADGSYLMSELPSGRYDISFSASGFLPEHATGVEVRTNDMAIANVVLETGGITISGHVGDSTGGIVVGAQVTALKLMSPTSAPVAFETESDERGAFRFTVAPGLYSLSVAASAYASEKKQVHARTPIQVEFSLIPGGQLSGLVKDAETRLPIPHAEVAVVTETASLSYLPVRSDEHGVFRFEGLEPGRYRVWARTNGGFLSGEHDVQIVPMEDVGIELLVSKGPSLGGVVRDSNGQAVLGARVRAQNSLDPRDRPVSVYSDASGAYELRGIPAGEVDFRVEAQGFSTASQVLTITGAQLQTYDVVLDAAVRIRGTVAAEVTDLREVCVTLAWTRSKATMPQLFQAIPTRQGLFEFANLPPGSGTLEAVLAGQGGSGIRVEPMGAGELKDVFLRIGSDGAWVSGSVRSANGDVLPGVTVLGHQSSRDGAHRSYSTASDADGHYRLGPFVGGQVEIIATADGSPGWGLGVPSTTPERATVVLEENGSATGVDVRIGLGRGRISGTVFDSNETPVPDAVVFAAMEANGAASRTSFGLRRAVTDVRGAFAFENLPTTGKHTLWATSQGFADTRISGVSPGGPATEIALAKAASVSGRVIDSTGAPLTDYTLRVFPVFTEVSGIHFGVSDLPMRRIHDQSGSFWIHGLTAGKYEILIQKPGGGAGHARFEAVGDQVLEDIAIVEASTEASN